MSDVLEPTTEAAEEFRALMQQPSARQAFIEAKAEQERSGAQRRYSHVLKFVGETVWAIRPAVLGVIVDVLAYRVQGGKYTPEEIEARVGAQGNQPSVASSDGGVAVIPIQGVIVPKADMFSEMSGGTSIQGLQQMFRSALADPGVKAIVFDVDSPGGAVDLVPEMGAEIRAARGQKPIVAVANTMAASGAYWLACQADELVITKSGQVGSIGVITSHEDWSKAEEMEGIHTTLISAGKYKDEGNPFEPLSDDARAYMQSRVDEFYGMFVGDVSKGRGVSVDTVRSGFGQGRMVSAKNAVSEGMADRVDTLDNVVAKLLNTKPAMAGDTGAAATSGQLQVVDADPGVLVPEGYKLDATGVTIPADVFTVGKSGSATYTGPVLTSVPSPDEVKVDPEALKIVAPRVPVPPPPVVPSDDGFDASMAAHPAGGPPKEPLTLEEMAALVADPEPDADPKAPQLSALEQLDVLVAEDTPPPMSEAEEELTRARLALEALDA